MPVARLNIACMPHNPVFAMSEPLTIMDLSDTTAPTLVSIEDDQGGGPVAVPNAVVYTVTFDKPMSAGSAGVDDFENASATLVTIDSVSPTANPAVYEVKVTTTEAGTLQLQIKQGAELANLPGNLLFLRAKVSRHRMLHSCSGRALAWDLPGPDFSVSMHQLEQQAP